MHAWGHQAWLSTEIAWRLCCRSHQVHTGSQGSPQSDDVFLGACVNTAQGTAC